MKQISMPVKSDSKINIKASGDLSIEGCDQNIMTAAVRHSDTLKISESGGLVELKATSDLRLRLPASQAVTVEKVGGDVQVAGLSDRVIIGKVAGDLVLLNLAGASVEMIGGDMSMQNTSGAVEVARVGGDLIGSDVETVFSRAVGGDIFLQGVKGSLNLVAGGDVEVELVTPDTQQVTITTGADVQLKVPVDFHAQLALNSGGRSIHIDACGQHGDWDQEEIAIPFGDGGNPVSVSAGGDISVSDHEEDSDEFSRRFKSSFDNWSSFGLDLEKQIQDSVAAATENIKWVSMGALGASEKARMKVEKAMRKLDDKGIRIDHKGIHVDQPGKSGRSVNVDAKGIHVGENGKVVGFTYPGEAKSGGTATDEERMIVLKMLQDKKITVEEAEKLLSALEK